MAVQSMACQALRAQGSLHGFASRVYYMAPNENTTVPGALGRARRPGRQNLRHKGAKQWSAPWLAFQMAAVRLFDSVC